jgi:hypothetical protein
MYMDALRMEETTEGVMKLALKPTVETAGVDGVGRRLRQLLSVKSG